MASYGQSSLPFFKVADLVASLSLLSKAATTHAGLLSFTALTVSQDETKTSSAMMSHAGSFLCLRAVPQWIVNRIPVKE